VDRVPIYLEKDDEITSVVDKLKNTDGVDLDVVIPKEAIMLQSVINLKLLKRQAEALGKEVTIVTQDKVGTKLAQQIGIPVVAKEGQIPKEVNMAESDEPGYSEEDIQMKENQAAEKVDTKEAAKTEEAKAPEDKEPEKPQKTKDSWFKRHKKGALIGGGFALLALAIAAYIYVPLANINISLAAENRKVDFTFTASKDANGVDNEKGIIPAREITEEVEKSETFKASGQKEVGEKATGSVTIFNNYSTTSQTLTAGDKLVGSGGLVFSLTSNVTVPGYTDPGTGKKPGSVANVLVRAAEVGEKYNLSNGSKFSIPRINSENFYAESQSAFSGGSSRKVKFVTANDISNAKDSIASGVESELNSKVRESAKDAILLEGALKAEEVSAQSSVASGAEAEEFKYTIKMKGVALVITEDDLKALAEDRFRKEIGETKEIVEAESLISSTKLTDLDIKQGEFRATLSGEAYIATKLEESDIRNSINGDSESLAIEYLTQIEGVENVEIKFFPKFYNRIPRVNSHIYIKTEILKNQLEK
jgi:hypothetical protein